MTVGETRRSNKRGARPANDILFGELSDGARLTVFRSELVPYHG